jgi:hypothetical protein
VISLSRVTGDLSNTKNRRWSLYQESQGISQTPKTEGDLFIKSHRGYLKHQKQKVISLSRVTGDLSNTKNRRRSLYHKSHGENKQLALPNAYYCTK